MMIIDFQTKMGYLSFISKKKNLMKNIKFYSILFVLLVLGCNKNDNNEIVENGTNPIPNLQVTGSSANAFLTSKKYTSLTIELFYVENFRPTTQALNNFKNFMEQRLNKSNGITIIEKQIVSPGTSPYDINEIVKIEKDNRTKFNTPDNLTLFLLFVDGNFSTDTNTTFTLGTAYRNTSCVIYENSIINLSNSIGGGRRTDLESTVLIHEICHLLGLVNLGTVMQINHEDAAHGGHCNNKNCLMYWQTEGNGIMGMMTGGNIPGLDANCLADLKANGGK